MEKFFVMSDLPNDTLRSVNKMEDPFGQQNIH